MISRCPLQWILKRWRIKQCRQHFLKWNALFLRQCLSTWSGWWSELSCWYCAGWWCSDCVRRSILHYGMSIYCTNYFLFILLKLLVWVWLFFFFFLNVSSGHFLINTPVTLPKCIGTPLSCLWERPPLVCHLFAGIFIILRWIVNTQAKYIRFILTHYP